MRKKILIWVQSSFGIGHFIMVKRFVTILNQIHPRVDVIILSGGHTEISDLNVIQLPKLIDDFDDRKKLSGKNLKDIFKQRKKIIQEVCDQYKPNILITEHFPFGRSNFREEVIELIDYVKDTCIIMTLIRDTIQRKNLRYLSEDLKLYQKILIAGDKNFFDISKEFKKIDNKKITYLGYIGPQNKYPLLKPKKTILVNVGGGVDGGKLIKKIIDISSNFDNDIFVVKGPLLKTKFEYQNNVKIYENSNVSEQLKNVGYFISTCGYNSGVESVLSNKPTLYFINNENKEQISRAKVFSKKFNFDYILSNQKKDHIEMSIKELLKKKPNKKKLELLIPSKLDFLNFSIDEIKYRLNKSTLFKNYYQILGQIRKDIEKFKVISTHNKTPEVSIVIPYRNQEIALYNTLESISNVNYNKDKYEIIIVNDDSDRIDNLANYDMNITYLECKRSNYDSEIPINRAGPIRNLGVRFAKGKRLIFLDSDMVVKPDFISRHMKFPDKLVLGLRNPDYRENYFRTFSDINKLDNKWYLVHSHNFSIEKKSFDDIGGFSDEYIYWGMEDLELGYRLFKKGVEFILDKNNVAMHQEHPPEQQSVILKKVSSIYQYVLFYKKYLDDIILKTFNFNLQRDTLKVFDKCNNNCIFCKNKKGDFKTGKEIIDELKYAKRLGMHIRLGGGEIALHPEILDILKEIKKLNLSVELVTNGRIFSNSKYSRLFSHYISYYYVYIYGSSEKTVERITKVKNGLKQTLKGIENLYTKNSLTFHVTLNKDSITELNSLYEKLVKYSKNLIRIEYVPENKPQKNIARIKKYSKNRSILLLDPFFECDKNSVQIRGCVKCSINEQCKHE